MGGPGVQIGQMMHTTPLPWKGDGSMAGVMLAPVAFAMLTVLGAVILLVIYVIMQVLIYRCLPFAVCDALHCHHS